MELLTKLKVVIVTGLSGAGKTKAVDWFEDQDYYCIDNMPPSLIKNFIDLTLNGTRNVTKAAFVVDSRTEEFFIDLNATLAYLDQNDRVDYKILYMEARNSVLVRRFNESRRNHPMSEGAVTSAVIDNERDLLKDIKAKADYIIDTSNFKLFNLEHEMIRLFSDAGGSKQVFAINIKSFGYKYGIPQETDFVFDMRFIPNPFYIPSLRKLSGHNQKVAHYVLKQDVTKTFIEQTVQMFELIIPKFIQEGKYHVNIAIGCTGGRHRSVAVANELARIFSEKEYSVSIEHRETKSR